MYALLIHLSLYEINAAVIYIEIKPNLWKFFLSVFTEPYLNVFGDYFLCVEWLQKYHNIL